MKRRWSIAAPQPELAKELAEATQVSPMLAQCLLNRGLSATSTIRAFLQPRLKDLADPFLLPNMAAAVERLYRARERKELLVIFGDYDVDGVTSTALLLEVLRALGWTVKAYLPHRMDEGYGLSQDAVENCLKQYPVSLLLAVDCGSTTVASVAWLRARGVDVIIVDHHQVSTPAPAATALVNPQIVGASSGHGPQSEVVGGVVEGGIQSAPFTELCSVGLAFKLAHALVKRGREEGMLEAVNFDLRPLLDLVALGTIADIVPLTGENRRLVSVGLERLSSTRRPGLVALRQVAQSPVMLGTYEVGFQLAPRLNAAGRLETAAEALELLLAEDMGKAAAIARNLDAHNRERQTIERTIAEEVIGALKPTFNAETDFVIVQGQMSWHIGVVGIVASRVLQQFYRPTIILGGNGGQFRGSGRSIAGFDLAAALRECDDLLVRHGGHAMAAGLALDPVNLDRFRVRLNELARRSLRPEQLQPELRLDAEVNLAEITLATLASLDQLKPIGQGNPSVQFFARDLACQGSPVRMGADKQHLKLRITDGITTQEAVWWGAKDQSLTSERFDLAFMPQTNEYHGRRTVQLKVLDWRPAQVAVRLAH